MARQGSPPRAARRHPSAGRTHVGPDSIDVRSASNRWSDGPMSAPLTERGLRLTVSRFDQTMELPSGDVCSALAATTGGDGRIMRNAHLFVFIPSIALLSCSTPNDATSSGASQGSSGSGAGGKDTSATDSGSGNGSGGGGGSASSTVSATSSTGSGGGGGGGEIRLTSPVLDHEVLLKGLAEKSFYRANIPFIELPDDGIQQIYYYRFSVMKRHLQETPGGSYVVTEFIAPVFWAAPFGGISLNTWHNNLDGRWLRDRQYLDDDTLYWMRGLGARLNDFTDQPGPRPLENDVYHNTMAASFYDRYLATGDAALIKDILPELIKHYNSREARQFDAAPGLYWTRPHDDGTEFTIAAFQTKDPFKGGIGYRPSINAYAYGDAMAIAKIAHLSGDEATAATFTAKATTLKQSVQAKLWDPGRSFFYHMMKDNAAQGYSAPEGTLLDGRELAGFIPWMYDMPDDTAPYAEAWKQIMDASGFNTPTGPAYAEARSPLYNRDANLGCCRWTGPNWPMATSQALVAMGNLLHDYKNNKAVTPADYFTILKKYTTLQFKDGKPHVAEAASSVDGAWIYDATGHSTDYNHSAYVDLVLSGLLGVRPREDDVFEIDPLVPSDWDYFAIEDLPYHGHLMTVLWDRNGGRYGHGAGLSIYEDGVLRKAAAGLSRITAQVGAPIVKAYARPENLAVNPFEIIDGGFAAPDNHPVNPYPKATASFTSPYDSPLRAIDGQILYDLPGNERNSRWTSYGSPNAADWLEVDFGKATSLSEVRLYFYDDGGGVQTPASYTLQYLSGASWLDIPGQKLTPAAPVGNEVNVVTFPSVTTTRLRAVLTSRPGAASGITEIETFAALTSKPMP